MHDKPQSEQRAHRSKPKQRGSTAMAINHGHQPWPSTILIS